MTEVRIDSLKECVQLYRRMGAYYFEFVSHPKLEMFGECMQSLSGFVNYFAFILHN